MKANIEIDERYARALVLSGLDLEAEYNICLPFGTVVQLIEKFIREEKEI